MEKPQPIGDGVWLFMNVMIVFIGFMVCMACVSFAQTYGKQSHLFDTYIQPVIVQIVMVITRLYDAVLT